MSSRKVHQSTFPKRITGLFLVLKRIIINNHLFYLSSVFERYQKERSAFVTSVADAASRSENIEILQNAGTMFVMGFTN